MLRSCPPVYLLCTTAAAANSFAQKCRSDSSVAGVDQAFYNMVQSCALSFQRANMVRRGNIIIRHHIHRLKNTQSCDSLSDDHKGITRQEQDKRETKDGGKADHF